MRTAIFTAASLVFATAACSPQRRDVQINWTFAGGQTCAAVGVATIEIDIGGEYLSPNQFACTNTDGSLNTGVDLGRFLVGGYDVTVTGLDASSNVTYTLEQTLVVRESSDPNVFNVDVPAFTPTPGGEGALTLYWTFGGESCAQSGVEVVYVDIDGTPVTDDNNNSAIPCDVRGNDGVQITQITSGTHAVSISATSGTGVVYSDNLSVNIADQIDTTLSPDLTAGGSDGGTDGGTDAGTDGGSDAGPLTASAELSWSFAGLSCADAQVTSVTVDIDGASAGTFACTTSNNDGTTIADVSAGSHSFTISAVRGSGQSSELVYATSGSGSSATFQAGSTTHLILNAAATSPGTGGVTLTPSFPSGGPDCTATTGTGPTVSYTLTGPGSATSSGSFICGGTTGTATLSICNPGSSGCSASNPGLAAGLWSISATTTANSTSYSAQSSFAVPNDAVGSGAVAFTSP